MDTNTTMNAGTSPDVNAIADTSVAVSPPALRNRQSELTMLAAPQTARETVLASHPAPDTDDHPQADVHAWTIERIFNNFPAAATDASAGLEAALANHDVATEAQARLVLATALTYLEQHQAADTHFRSAMQRFAELGDVGGELLASGRHAATMIFLGDAAEAEQQLVNGLVRARRLGDRRVLIEHLINLAAVTRFALRYHEAITYLVECRALAQREQWVFAQLIAVSHLAAAYIGLHDYESGALACREAIEIIGDNEQYATLLVYFIHHLALAEKHTGPAAIAIQRFVETAELAASRQDARSYALARLEEARLRRSSGDAAGALTAYQQAVDIWHTHKIVNTATQTGTGVEVDNELTVLARWGVEALTGTWTWDTVHAINALLEERRPLGKEGLIPLHDALAESYRGLGDYPAAYTQLERCIALREEIWNDTLQMHAYASAKAEQTREARQRADVERWLREEADRNLQQMAAMNAENAVLIQRLQEQTEQLAQLSRTDDLTNLSNRRHFDEQFRQELARAEMFGRPLTVGLADIDDFKQVNDEWSHATGDRVLRQMATIMRRVTRETDLVARYGGEEFALLLPETTIEDAARLAERIRAAVEDYPWWEIAPGMNITVSIGLWSTVGVGSADEALARADEQMYRAKRAGKNQVVAL